MPISHPLVQLTQAQHNVLTGLMLGDGHLTRSQATANASLVVGRSTKDEEYLRQQMKVFENFLSPQYQGGQVRYCRTIDKRTGKPRSDCYFATIASPTFTEYHDIWYHWIGNKYVKVVPSYLQLNAQIIAHWISDDGSIAYNKLPYRLTCEISTHGFLQEEVQFLAHLLTDRYREDFLVRPKTKNGKTYFIIKAYDSACRAMFLDIDPYFEMVRKRIWDHPESRFWVDPPERQTSLLDRYNDRKAILDRIIQAGQPVTLKQLAESLGYVYQGKTDYKSINKLLRPYLISGKISKSVDRFDNNTTTIKVMT